MKCAFDIGSVLAERLEQREEVKRGTKTLVASVGISHRKERPLISTGWPFLSLHEQS